MRNPLCESLADPEVTSAQAESTLNQNMATEFDSDDGDTPDKEVKAEMEVLLEQEILTNPEGLNYRCHSLDLSTLTQAELDDITTADTRRAAGAHLIIKCNPRILTEIIRF